MSQLFDIYVKDSDKMKNLLNYIIAHKDKKYEKISISTELKILETIVSDYLSYLEECGVLEATLDITYGITQYTLDPAFEKGTVNQIYEYISTN